jgi:drug/metabolite transporter (DMT)-like permease
MLYLALTIAAALAAAGQVLLKLGATGQTVGLALANGRVVLGLGCYALGLVLWLVALTKLPLYVVYPFTLLTSALVLIGAVIWLGERPSAMAWFGWAVVAIGIGLIAWGSNSAAA